MIAGRMSDELQTNGGKYPQFRGKQFETPRLRVSLVNINITSSRIRGFEFAALCDIKNEIEVGN